jgi:hypothetical protein
MPEIDVGDSVISIGEGRQKLSHENLRRIGKTESCSYEGLWGSHSPNLIWPELVELKLDPNLPLAPIDGAPIEQVLLALMMNAMDAMPKGGNLWITSECNQGDRLCIIVRGDGAGIPAGIGREFVNRSSPPSRPEREWDWGWLSAAAFSSATTARSRSIRNSAEARFLR